MDTDKNVDEQVVKRKKGRPRKDATIPVEPKVKDEVTIDVNGEPVKKKRGRKKKDVVVEEVKQKKKRGRKAAVKYFSSSIRKKIPLTTVVQENNNFILHLDLKDDKQEVQKVDDVKGENSIIDTVFDTLKNEIELTDDVEGLVEDFEDIKIDKGLGVDLKELYKSRIESRETQDKMLVQKLEMLHNDESFINKLVYDKNNEVSKETINNKNLVEAKTQKENRKKGFFEILYKFVHNSDWLEKTDVHCWWCCHQFESLPIGLPIDFDTATKKFRVKGVFCSFACMVAYKNEQKYRNKDSLIKYMYKKLGEGNGNSVLPCAPPRCVLKMFGGDLTIEEFRSSTNENKMYKMIEYPMFMSKEYVEEIDILNIKNANVKVFDDTSFTKVVSLDDKRVADAKMRLLQIEKSTVTVGNTIDKFINFT
jgi:hypothetical protein